MKKVIQVVLVLSLILGIVFVTHAQSWWVKFVPKGTQNVWVSTSAVNEEGRSVGSSLSFYDIEGSIAVLNYYGCIVKDSGDAWEVSGPPNLSVTWDEDHNPPPFNGLLASSQWLHIYCQGDVCVEPY
jgi:hypothetical protein